MIVFSAYMVDGGDQIACTNIFSSFETWVTPVFAIPPQGSVWRVEFTIDQLPIICSLSSVFAIIKTPLKVSLLVKPLTVTIREK